jgi:outer membrane protein assembly factor BamB
MPRNRTTVARLASLFLLLTCTAAFAEQTGTPRRLIAGDYDTKRLAIVAPDGKIEWEEKIGGECHDLQVLPNGNVLFQQSWTKIVEMTPKHEVVWSYDSAKMNGNAGKAVQVHAFQRLPDGNTTMLAESGPGRIIEVDKDGKLLKEIKLKVGKPDPHRDTRLVRKLDNGHYLVAHEGDNAVREYDDAGKVVWEYAVGSRVYSATRLKNGNTLIGAGDGHRVIEVDPAGKTVWSLNEHDLPGGVTLAWVTMVDRLPSGNTLVVNCHAGPTNPQIIEVTPDKKVVWSFKDFDHFGNALPVALLLPEAR